MRSGMYPIIDTLRGMTATGEGDYTVNDVSYWSSLQLQDYLDKHRSDYYDKLILAVDEMSGGSVVTTRYYLGNFNVEGGTAVFWIANASGVKLTPTTDYTVDYALGLVTFTADTHGAAYYATYHAYDLNAAAADIYRAKAAHYADYFNFSTHGHQVNKGDLIKNALTMAEYYSTSGGMRAIDLDRSDTC